MHLGSATGQSSRAATASGWTVAGRDRPTHLNASRLIFSVVSVCALLVSIFFGAPWARAQDLSDPVIIAQGGNPRGMLIVYLQGDDGIPVGTNGVVTIFRAGEVSGPHQDTGASGVARFVQLTNAAYTIVVTVPGYKDARTEADIAPNHTVAEVTVTMERVAGNPADEGNAKGIVLAPKAKKEVQEGLDAMRTENYDVAEKHLMAAYKLAPGNPDVNDRLGELYLEKSDYLNAELYLKQALSLEPDNIVALTDMGWLRVQQGDNAAAETALQHAIALDPQRWFAHWVLGVAYLRQHDYERARLEALAAIKAGKGAALDAEYLLGESLAAAGRNEEAIKALQDFIRDGPNNGNAKAAQTLIANLRAAESRAATQTATDHQRDPTSGNDGSHIH